jgi:fibronectin-binding autotransporter adhesin
MNLSLKKYKSSIRRKTLSRAVALNFRKAGMLAAALVAAPAIGSAATLYWDTTTTGLWSNATNWWITPGGTINPVAAPGSLDSAFFNGTGVNGDEIIQVGVPTSILGITFANTGTTTINQTASGTLSIGTGGLTLISGSGPISIGVPTIFSGAQAWTAASGTSLTFNSTVTHNGATVDFTNFATGATLNSSFFANTNDIIGAWATTGTAGATTYAVRDGGNNIIGLGYTGGADGSAAAASTNVTDTTGAVNYTLGAGGTLGTSASINTLRYTGALGTLTTTTAFTTNGLLNAGTGLLTINGAVTIGSTKELVVNTASGGITLSAAIVNNGGGASGLTKTGVGTLTLSGINTFTGAVNVNAGILTSAAASGGVGTGTFLGGVGTSVARRTVNIASGAQVSYTNGAGNSFLALGGTVATGGYGAFYDINVSGTLAINDAAAVSQILHSTFNLNNGGIITNTGVASNGAYGLLFGWNTGGGGNINVSGTGNQINADRIGFFNNATITTNAGAELTINSIIGGASQVANTVIKAGAGTLILNGINTYTGTTTVTGGTLILTGANTSTATTTITGGSLLLSNALALQNSTLTTGGIVFDSSVASHAFTLGGLSGSGNIVLADNAGSPNAVALSVGNNIATTTYIGVLSGSGSLTKIGTGTTSLSGTQTYTGGTTVNSGALSLLNTNVQPASGSITVAASATLGLGVGTTGNLFTSADVDSLFAGTMANVANSATSNVGIDTTAGDFIYATNLAGTTRGLVKLGANALNLTGNNSSFTGNVILSAGTLNLNSPTAGGAGGVIVNAGTLNINNPTAVGTGTFSINGGTINNPTSAISLTNNNPITIGGDFAYGGTNDLNMGTGAVALGNANRIITLNGNSTLTIGGVISSTGAFGLGTTGPGTLVLSGSNTFTGIVNPNGGSTLSINAVSALGNGTGASYIAIQNSGTLKYTGTGSETIAGRDFYWNAGAATINIASPTGSLTITPTTVGANQRISTLTKTGLGSLTLNGIVQGGSLTVNQGAMSVTGIISAATAINVTGGLLDLSAVNTHTGSTTVSGGTLNITGSPTGVSATNVNGGTLNLDYTVNNTSKIANTAVLAFGGGTLNLNGGSHTETVGSTTLNAGPRSFVTTTGGTSVLQMNAITRNAGASIDFAAANIATTDTLNTNGILGGWATVGGSGWAMNSTNAADGLITAFSGYTDVTRLNSGVQVIADDATANIRIVEGTGSAANITLGVATTTINTLNQSTTGGTSASTIDPAGQTLAVNSILLGSGAGGLTIGNGANNGTLKTANVASGGDLILNNQSASVLTINSAIVNNTASALTKLGSGPASLTGVNTYTGATNVYGGTLQVANGGSITTTSAITMSGGTLEVATGGSVSTTQSITMGGGSGATGTLSITGGSVTSSLNSTLAFLVGNGSTGAFNMSAGSVTLTGAASAPVMGNNGPAQWTQTGGTVSLAGNAFYTGNNLGGESQMDISGGTLTGNASSFQFGQRANSTLNLSNSAVVTFNSLVSGGSAPSNNVINFGDGVNFSGGANIAAGGTSGKLIIGAMTRTSGTLALNFNGGTLQAKAASAAYLGAATVTVQDAGGVIDNGGFAISIVPSLAHAGVAATDAGMIFKGTGITTLSGTNTYNGGTAVTAGTLTYLSTNAKPAAGTTTVAAGATLGLGVATSGSFFTSVEVNSLFANTLTNVSMNPTANVGIDTTAGNFTYANSYAGSPTRGLTKLGTNSLILSGANTYTGLTTVAVGNLIAGTPAGVVAIPGDIAMSTTGTAMWFTANNQLSGTGILSTFGANTDYGRFNLSGTSQTVGGLSDTTGRLVVQNNEAPAPVGSGTSTLTINVSGANSYSTNGYIRSSGGILGVIKTGTGTQTFSGANVNYTGPTTVSNGRLILQTTAFASAITNTSEVEFNGVGATSGAILGSGNYYKTGAGITQFNGAGQIIGATGQIYIQQGTIQNSNNSVNWTGNTSVDISSGAILDLFADPIQVSKLTGTGFVQNNYGNNAGQSGSAIYFEKLTVGAANGSSTFDGVIRNNSFGTTPALGALGGGIQLEKIGTGTLTLTGTNAYTGSTTVNAGTLDLNYDTNNTTKIADTGVLILGGGTLNLTGGSHTEIAASTTLTANTRSFVTRTSGSSVLQMNAITRNTLSTIDFGTSGIATTDTLNTNGILGGWATVGGSDWAMNSTNAADGLITAYTAYTDVTRLNSGTQVIANNAANNVRIIEGTGSATNITLEAATTTINTLNQSASGGTSAATINPNNQILAVSGILLGTGAGGLTIGNGSNNGTLQAATSGGDLLLNNLSANALTINSVIGATGASTLTKLGTGTVILNGINTYTGATSIVPGGTLQIGSAGRLGSGTYAGAITNSGTLQFSSSAAQTLSGVISGAGALTKDTSNSVLTLTGINTFTGTTTVSSGTLITSVGGRLNNTANIIVDSGATLRLSGTAGATGNNQLQSAAVSPTLTIAGTLDVATNTANTMYATTITLNNGTMTSTGVPGAANDGAAGQYGAYYFGLNRTVNANGANNVLSGNGKVGIASGVVLTLNTPLSTDALSVSTALGVGNSGTAGGLTKTGLGTVTLNSANAYTGATNVTAGKLVVSSTGTINGTSGLTITGGGEFKYNNTTTSFTKPITLTNGTISGTGTITQPLTVGANGIISPGNSPGIQPFGSTQTWTAGGTYTWEVNNWTGTTAGTDYDRIAITGGLDIAALSSPSSRFNIDINGLTVGNIVGAVLGFNNSVARSWTILTTTTGLSGQAFNPNLFNIVTTNFTTSNDLGGGSFGLTTVGNDLVLNFNPAVVAGPNVTVTGVTNQNLFVLQGASLSTQTATANFTNSNANAATINTPTSSPTGLLTGTTTSIAASPGATATSTISLISTSTNTTAIGATLTYPTTAANTGSAIATVNVRIGNAPLHATASSTNFGEALIAATPISVTPYTGLSSNTIGQVSTGSTVPTLGTTATIFNYTNSTGTDTGISMAWRSRTAAEASSTTPGDNGTLVAGYLVSDVVNLTGMGNAGGTGFTDTFILQMSYNEALLNGFESFGVTQGNIKIVWKNGTEWVNAVTGNSTTASQYFPNQAYNASARVLGDYGIDPTNNVVWAVLNHNSEFAVIPEPSTLVLGGLALLGFAGVGLRRRRLAKTQG